MELTDLMVVQQGSTQDVEESVQILISPEVIQQRWLFIDNLSFGLNWLWALRNINIFLSVLRLHLGFQLDFISLLDFVYFRVYDRI